MKAELLAGNTICSCHFPPQKKAKARSARTLLSDALMSGMGAPSHTELKREHQKPTPAKDTTKPPYFQLFQRLCFPGALEKQAAGGSQAQV